MLKFALITILGLSGYLTLNSTNTIEIKAISEATEPIKIIQGVVTAYSSEKSQTDDSPDLTASQKKVREGFIACSRKYKFGTQFEIEGKIYICEDRKNIRYESYDQEWFDLWFETTEEALEYGIKELSIKILN